MKIALVHDFLIQAGGAEKNLEVFQEIWPKAPTYTLFFDPKKLPTFSGRDIRTSFLQRLPLALKKYHRDSHVIYPPVETQNFHLSNAPKTYFLTGGRLVPYKRYDLVVEAANKTGIPLKIFGDGPVEADLRKMAKSNIEFCGRVSEKQKAELYANAKAFIHPQEEDFSITAVESMASGRPVIAYKKGGATETVVEGLSGEFLESQTWEELADHMIRFDEHRYDSVKIKHHADQFSHKRFVEELKTFVEKTYANPGRY